jgi:cysteine desulfurase/selenocysteine lyase
LSLHRIYLDNAATSWPKPESVYVAVDRYLRDIGAAAGRSVYQEAADARKAIDMARRALARLIGADDPSHIVFTANGSDALNLAIHGVLRAGDHAICTDGDHNSVLRPLRSCQDGLGVEITHVRCDSAGWVNPDDVRQALRPNTRLVAMLHASNVTGVIEPAADVGKVCRQHGAIFLLDAAQSLGHMPIDVENLYADLLAAPGHKGLLGPLGTGVLYVRPGVGKRLRPIRQGGTGSHSESDLQPQTLPEKYEAGNLNVAGIAGLFAGIEWLEQQKISTIRQHELTLTAKLVSGLSQIAGITVYGPKEPAERVGVVSVSIDGYDPQEAAAALDSAFRVQVRAGLHCAPRIHQAMGTLDRGGTVRFSIGPFNTAEDIDAAVHAVREIA